MHIGMVSRASLPVWASWLSSWGAYVGLKAFLRYSVFIDDQTSGDEVGLHHDKIVCIPRPKSQRRWHMQTIACVLPAFCHRWLYCTRKFFVITVPEGCLLKV
jgi:hypothetical protein